MSTATIVGSGPNGLTAAALLAKAGVQVTVFEAADEIGGGTRTTEGIVAGLLHDHCSAIHPMAVGSTALQSLDLHRHGLEWRWPEIDCVHPLDSGDAGVLYRSVAETAAGLGADGRAWRALFEGPVAGYDELAQDIMGPLVALPRHPLHFAGGDIMTGAKDLRQLVFGPRTTLDPYSTGLPGTYLCSAATPPGPGAHGMCGANAAARALRHLQDR